MFLTHQRLQTYKYLADTGSTGSLPITTWFSARGRSVSNVYPLTDGPHAFRDLENNREGRMPKVFLERRVSYGMNRIVEGWR